MHIATDIEIEFFVNCMRHLRAIFPILRSVNQELITDVELKKLDEDIKSLRKLWETQKPLEIAEIGCNPK